MKNESIHIRQIRVRVHPGQEATPLWQVQKEMEQKATEVIHQVVQNALKSGELDD